MSLKKKGAIALGMALAVFAILAIHAARSVIKVEDYAWSLDTLQNGEGQVVACAPGQKDLYPHAEAIELTFTAEHGRLTCSRENITGTYRQTETNPDGSLYELYVEGWGQGFGGCAYTKHATRETVPTFAVQFPERYSIYFTGE